MFAITSLVSLVLALVPVPQAWDIGPLSFGQSVDELREALGPGKTIGNKAIPNCYAGPYLIDRFTDGRAIVYADIQDGVVSMFTIDLMPASIPKQAHIPQRAGFIADWKWQGHRIATAPFPLQSIYRKNRVTIKRREQNAIEEVFSFAGEHDPVVSVTTLNHSRKIAKILECYPD